MAALTPAKAALSRHGRRLEGQQLPVRPQRAGFGAHTRRAAALVRQAERTLPQGRNGGLELLALEVGGERGRRRWQRD